MQSDSHENRAPTPLPSLNEPLSPIQENHIEDDESFEDSFFNHDELTQSANLREANEHMLYHGLVDTLATCDESVVIEEAWDQLCMKKWNVPRFTT